MSEKHRVIRNTEEAQRVMEPIFRKWRHERYGIGHYEVETVEWHWREFEQVLHIATGASLVKISNHLSEYKDYFPDIMTEAKRQKKQDKKHEQFLEEKLKEAKQIARGLEYLYAPRWLGSNKNS